MVTVGYDGAVAVFSLDTHQVELLGYHEHLVNKVAVSPAGSYAASCSSDYTVQIWDLSARRSVAELRGHSDDVEDFVFIDHRIGASASRDHRILVWDFTTGDVVRQIDGHDKDVLSLAYHGGRLYSAGDDKTLRVWDLDASDRVVLVGDYWGNLIRVALDSGGVTRAAIARNGISSLTRCCDLVVAASYDGTLQAVHPDSLAVLRRLGAMRQRPDDDKDPGR